ncbi:MAG: hypothetical protein C4523_08865 [Myxococcales bacterium]|nr:MAG: hypothetical protein C4523_08865 [Myxococcales bacterium]
MPTNYSTDPCFATDEPADVRAARATEALVHRLNATDDPDLCREAVKALADRIGVPIRLGDGGWPPKEAAEFYRVGNGGSGRGRIYRVAPGKDLDLVHWFVETQESDDGGVPVVVGDADPVRNAAFLADAFLEAFIAAGYDMERRVVLVRRVVRHIERVRAVVERWDAEMAKAEAYGGRG